MPAKPQRPAGRRPGLGRLAFEVHSWVGLKLSVLLALVLVSGTLAVFRDEVDWLIYPAMRVEPLDRRVGLEAIRAAVLDAHPDVIFQTGFSTGADRGATAVGVIGVTAELGVRIFWVDQYRGRFTGTTPYFSPGYVLGQLHARLLLPLGGDVIVTTLSFVLLGSLVTGLITYKRFWRGFLRRPRWRDARTALGDLHRLLALWSLWFVALMVLTGLWYFWTLVAVRDLGAPSPHVEPEPPVLALAALPQSADAAARRIDMDAAARIAAAHRPGFVPLYIEPPGNARGVFEVHGTSGELLAPYASVVFVDPYAGTVIGADHAADAPLITRIDYAVTPLHFGTWGGTSGAWALASKTLWFVFGAGLSFLAISGVLIFWRRIARKPVVPQSRLRRWLSPRSGTLGLLKLPSVVLLACAVGGGIAAFTFMNASTAAYSRALPAQRLGEVALAPGLNPGPGGGTDVFAPGARPYVLIEGFEQLRRDYRSIAVARPGAGEDGWQEISGSGLIGVARLPPAPDGPFGLQLRAIGWDGTETRLAW